jgi:hypothetical protein
MTLERQSNFRQSFIVSLTRPRDEQVNSAVIAMKSNRSHSSFSAKITKSVVLIVLEIFT